MTVAPEYQNAPLGVAIITLVGGDATARCAAVTGQQLNEIDPVPVMIASNLQDGRTVPLRRGRAITIAQTQLVALIEDTTLIGADWRDAVVAAFADPTVGAVWGPVRIDPNLPARFRALGRLEYGRFDGRAPLPDTMPGNCFALRRDALVKADFAADGGIVEHMLAKALYASDLSIRCLEAALVTYAVADRYGAKLSTRFGHGRLYGGTRAGDLTFAGRLVQVLKSPLVPAVLTARAVSWAASTAPVRVWLAELPWIGLMALAWGAGELTGALFGVGQSEGSWR